MRWPNGKPLGGSKPYNIAFVDFAFSGGAIASDVVAAERLPVTLIDRSTSIYPQLVYTSLPRRFISSISHVVQETSKLPP